jgi:transposase
VLEVAKGRTVEFASKVLKFTNSALRKWIRRYVKHGLEGLNDLPHTGRPKKITPQIEERIVQLLQEDPLSYNSIYSQWTCSELLRVLKQETNIEICSDSLRRILKKKGFNYYRPTIELGANPEEIARAKEEIEELKKRAEQNEIILLFEDETTVWRFALPRAGWWYKDQRFRVNDLRLPKIAVKNQEKKKRQEWCQYRSWSRVTCGVLLCVVGIVQYLTSKVLFKIVPHFDGKEFKQFLYQIIHCYKNENKKIVMILDLSWIHKAKTLKSFLALYQDKFEFYFLPAHSGHHLNVIEGFWHPVKEAIGSNRSYSDIHALYQRTRTVLSKHQAQPIFHFNW